MHQGYARTFENLFPGSVYDKAPVGLCVLSRDLRFLHINETMAQFNGHKAEDHIGQRLSQVLPGLEGAARDLMNELLATGQTLGPFEVVGETPARPGETRYWMEVWSPLTDEQGEIIAASIAAIEITERKRLEKEKDQALEETRKRLVQQTAIAETSQLALRSGDLKQVFEKAVTVAAQALDVPYTKILAFEDSAEHLKLVAGVGWAEGLVGNARVGADRASQAGYTLLAKKIVIVDDLVSEDRFSGPALLHEHKVVSGMSVTIDGANGRPFGVFGVHTTQSRRFDQGDANFLVSLAAIVSNAVIRDSAKIQSTLLVREISHRAGNLLQLVSSIANQTFRNAENVHEAKAAFSQRLTSLARTNQAILQAGWSSTRFRKVVEETLAPFAERIRMTGRDILLSPELSFDLGLVLNELCTNSSKYGSLGIQDGAVSLTWKIIPGEPPMFQADWNDPVSRTQPAAVSTSSGFGSKLIVQLIEKKWKGKLSVSQDTGYHMSFTVPLTQNTVKRSELESEAPI